ncbi:MAG: hypothetical protein KKB82_08335 [Candidatus Omnitrophica bacterium]|nr:hypothetical protein [Candidatus Omnitrophota bacterium]
MARKLVFKLFAILLVAYFVTPAFAQRGAKAKAKHADKNKDGVVTQREWKIENKWEAKQKSRVNNAVEKRYDADGNGWLEPGETKEMLKDKYRLIQTNGRAKVDTPAEAAYDTNSDGIIDVQEAAGLKQALGE